MNVDWRRLLLQVLLAVGVGVLLLFATSTTTQLHERERRIHAGAQREAQSGDPSAAYLEIVLEASPLAPLSSGFAGIAPSMHLIRLSATRPLSNIDPIEHPSRRRFGRIDLSFAFLVVLPIALIPLCYLIYRRCLSKGDLEKLASGKTKFFDFCVERILLPVLGASGFVLLVTMACLYSSGLRLGSNELLGRVAIWAFLLAAYLFTWMLLLTYLLLRASSFSSATIQYASIFLLVVILIPQGIESLLLAIERPQGRLPLIVERRQALNDLRRDDQAGIDRYFQRQGYKALDWSQPLTGPQASAIENLRVEEKIAPRLRQFEDNVRKLDQMALWSSWISPFMTAQYGLDDLAGTGLARYSRFRGDAIAFHEQWRKYTLGYLAKRQFLDYDGLRYAPKFKQGTEELGNVLASALVKCAYFSILCILLLVAIVKRLSKVLPQRKRAAR